MADDVTDNTACGHWLTARPLARGTVVPDGGGGEATRLRACAELPLRYYTWLRHPPTMSRHFIPEFHLGE